MMISDGCVRIKPAGGTYVHQRALCFQTSYIRHPTSLLVAATAIVASVVALVVRATRLVALCDILVGNLVAGLVGLHPRHFLIEAFGEFSRDGAAQSARGLTDVQVVGGTCLLYRARLFVHLVGDRALDDGIDGEELARRMNLKIRRVRFEWGSNIQGRIYFDTTKVTLRDRNGQLTEEMIDPGTILINTDLCPTKEMENSTIVHECVHMFLDLPFFLLQMMKKVCGSGIL